MTDIKFEKAPDGTSIAWRQDGRDDLGRCGFVWLGGYKSDMEGSKAEALAALARETRRACLRFDYSGHGASGGLFVDGTISKWLEQSAHMLLTHGRGPRILVGSSMGGWLALLLYRLLQLKAPAAAQAIKGLVLLAPAADMTEDLMWDEFPEAVRTELNDKGVWLRPSAYGEPYAITRRLIEDGRRHLMLNQGLDVACPVRILQGDADPDVPAAHAVKVFGALRGADVTLTLIKGGDHRLSTPANLSLLRDTVLRLAERSEGIGV
ncbi:alpha/beta hydrolase [Aestuariivirga litoralis]|uniref:Palmitoyl-protein thioesterase ABHD10, mitochondrial n=1 Tax=Aestuariivirga litoralis TaxID=2650924 RepID=A0A2W2AVJ4_9HYPH|nr:alpha/beta fold hydrolase [Aestuariivirga litoralis]PZF76640.1 alpha/beta hydrolase [Aestuariivirga litoralis]